MRNPAGTVNFLLERKIVAAGARSWKIESFVSNLVNAGQPNPTSFGAFVQLATVLRFGYLV